jgi:hypothetical protein
LAVRQYATEFDTEPLRLVSGSDPDGGDGGATFVERVIRQRGAFFPGDWR